VSEQDKERGSGQDARAGQPDEARKRKRKRRGGRSRRGITEGGQNEGAQARAGEARRRRSRAGEPRSGEPRPGEPRPSEPRSAESRPGESRSTEPRPGESRSTEPRPGESRSAESRPRGEARPGEAGDREKRRRRRRRREGGPDSAQTATHADAGQDESGAPRGEDKRPRRRRRSQRDGTEPSRPPRRAAAAHDAALPAAGDRDQRDEPDGRDGRPLLSRDLDSDAFAAARLEQGLAPDLDSDLDSDREAHDAQEATLASADEDEDEDFFALLDQRDALDLPEPDADDPDPVSFGIEEIEVDERASLATGVRNVVGVKFGSAGRIYLHDSGDEHYQRGEEVVVEGERGTRLGTVAVPSMRQATRKQTLPLALRRPNRSDRRAQERNHERGEHALEIARATARSLELPMKVFRAAYAHSGKKLTIYFNSEERIDFRDLVRRLTAELHTRVEMRQTGVRDEAKYVGGIGSCGRELCCTTWLPEFVPVSIKMAKDQGMVLNPTKVSGQCGRLKCCLVYEQATYAEMRKGLPKLGKRVTTEEGEGRVVEVDVLRQRVRVSLGPGEFRVFAGHEVTPLFPSHAGKSSRK
jgi:cell fate regulator YaaT (PSP1 superfamily)